MAETYKTRIPCEDCARRKKAIEQLGKEEFVSCEPTAEDPKICWLITRKKAKPKDG
jgi:hypothetical protein